MDQHKRNLQGSPNRDLFKKMHKTLDRSFYATDIDFALIESNPPGIVAFLDYKHTKDTVTFSEIIAYNALLAIAPVFIVQSANPQAGPFSVYRYTGGNSKTSAAILKFEESCKDWRDLGNFERKLRSSWKASR